MDHRRCAPGTGVRGARRRGCSGGAAGGRPGVGFVRHFPGGDPRQGGPAVGTRVALSCWN